MTRRVTMLFQKIEQPLRLALRRVPLAQDSRSLALLPHGIAKIILSNPKHIKRNSSQP